MTDKTDDFKPIIAISAQREDLREVGAFSCRTRYINYLHKMGAVSFVITYDENNDSEEELSMLLDLCDGIFVPGGNDVQPYMYGSDKTDTKYLGSPERDHNETLICKLALERKIPFLGVCRGVQIANVAFGGTLCHDILEYRPESFDHWQMDSTNEVVHGVDLSEGGLLAKICGSSHIDVNSIHHQAIVDVADGLLLEGVADDGTIEALSAPNHPFFLGVQWHPEFMPENENSMKILNAFCEACREYHQSK